MEETINIAPDKYTDKDMQAVARLAYINFSDDMIWDNDNKRARTFGEFLKEERYYKEFSEALLKDGANSEPGSLERAMYEYNVELLNELKDGAYSNWKIVDYTNYNEKNAGDANGFCAITIETDADSAIVGFRGSENGIANVFKDDKIAIDDWIKADLGLLD